MTCLTTVTCLLTLLTGFCSASLLGVDFGTDRIKVAAVAPGRLFEIVLDESSKRSHPNLIVFDESVRLYGNSAKSLVSRRPLNSFMYYTRALGKPGNSSLVEDLRESYVLNPASTDEKRNSVRFASPYFDLGLASGSEDEDEYSSLAASSVASFSVEELTAMKLQHIKAIAEADSSSGAEVFDCVVTVPCFSSDKERQALLDSARLAGLNVLALINENTAAAVTYAINWNWTPNAPDQYYIFYNLGAFSTQVSLVRYFTYNVTVGKYSKKTEEVGAFEVIQHEWDERLGAANFDRALSKLIIERMRPVLKSKAQMDEAQISELLSKPRTLTRIRDSAQSAKKILTGNKETRVHIESVAQDVDFTTILNRAQFEETAEDLFQRLTLPIERIVNGDRLKQFNITADNITAIVALGGGSRIPKVKEILNAFFEDKTLLENLNADEAPAVGASFRAANISNAFRVRQIGMDDVNPFAIGVRVTDLNAEAVESESTEDGSEEEDEESSKVFSKHGALFDRFNRLHKKRALSLKHAKDLRVQLFYEESAAMPIDTTHELGSFEISGIEKGIKKYVDGDAFNVTDLPKVSLSFLLDHNSQVKLVGASATFFETYQGKESKKSKKKKEKTKADKKAEAEESNKTNDDATAENGTDNIKNNADANAEEKDANSEQSAEETETASSESLPESAKEEETAESRSAEESTETSAEETNKSEDESSEESGKEEEKLVTKTRKYKIILDVKRIKPTDVRPYTEMDFSASRKVLRSLDKRDNAVRAIASAQNALESYIFESRNRVYDDDNVEKVSTEAERESVSSAMTSAEDWIWEVPEEEKSAEVFKDKLRELKDLSKAMFKRATEMDERPKAVSAAKKSIGRLFEFVEILRANYSWIDEEETEKVLEMTQSARDWLATKESEQSELALTETPAFYARDVDFQVTPILRLATKLLERKPSKAWLKAQKELKKAAAANATNGTNATDGESEELQTQLDIEIDEEFEEDSDEDNEDSEEDAESEEEEDIETEEETPKEDL